MKKDSGFTLIEVLVALAILSIALVGIIGAVSAYTDSTTGMRARLAAHWAAMNAVATAALNPADLSSTTTQEDIGGYTWDVEVTVEDTDLPTAKKVSARATAARGTGVGALAVGYVTVPGK